MKDLGNHGRTRDLGDTLFSGRYSTGVGFIRISRGAGVALVLSIIVIIPFFLGPVHGALVFNVSGPFKAVTDLCTQNGTGCGTDFAFNHKMFFAQSRWWIVYPRFDTRLAIATAPAASGPWTNSSIPNSPLTGEAVNLGVDYNATHVFVAVNGAGGGTCVVCFWYGALSSSGTVAWSATITVLASGFGFMWMAYQASAHTAYIFTDQRAGFYASTNIGFTTWSAVQTMHTPVTGNWFYSTTDTGAGLYVFYYQWYGGGSLTKAPGVFGKLLNSGSFLGGLTQGPEETVPYPAGVEFFNGVNALTAATHTGGSPVPGQNILGAYSGGSVIASYPGPIIFDKNQTMSDSVIACCAGSVAVTVTPSLAGEVGVLSTFIGDGIFGGQAPATISGVTDTQGNAWTKQVTSSCAVGCILSPTDVEQWTGTLSSTTSDTITATLTWGASTDPMAAGSIIDLYRNVASIGNTGSTTSTSPSSFTVTGPGVNNFQQTPTSLVVGAIGIDLSGDGTCPTITPGSGQTQRGQDHLCGAGFIGFDTEEEPGGSSVTYSTSWTGTDGSAQAGVVLVSKVPSQNNGVDAVGTCYSLSASFSSSINEIDLAMNGTGTLSAQIAIYKGTSGGQPFSVPTGTALGTSNAVTNLPQGSTPANVVFTFPSNVPIGPGGNWCWVVEGLSSAGSPVYSVKYTGTARQSFYWNGTAQAWQTSHAATNGFPFVTVKQFSTIANFAYQVSSWYNGAHVSVSLGYGNNGVQDTPGGSIQAWGTNVGNNTYTISQFYSTRDSTGTFTVPVLPATNPLGWCVTFDQASGFSMTSSGSNGLPLGLLDPNFVSAGSLQQATFLNAGGGGSGQGMCPEYAGTVLGNSEILIGQPNGTSTNNPQIWVTAVDFVQSSIPPGGGSGPTTTPQSFPPSNPVVQPTTSTTPYYLLDIGIGATALFSVLVFVAWKKREGAPQ